MRNHEKEESEREQEQEQEQDDDVLWQYTDSSPVDVISVYDPLLEQVWLHLLLVLSFLVAFNLIFLHFLLLFLFCSILNLVF